MNKIQIEGNREKTDSIQKYYFLINSHNLHYEPIIFSCWKSHILRKFSLLFFCVCVCVYHILYILKTAYSEPLAQCNFVCVCVYKVFPHLREKRKHFSCRLFKKKWHLTEAAQKPGIREIIPMEMH